MSGITDQVSKISELENMTYRQEIEYVIDIVKECMPSSPSKDAVLTMFDSVLKCIENHKGEVL